LEVPVSVNVVIVGHVDHGKSTLIGRLLYDSDSITEGRVTEVQKLAEEYKKRFEFAYFLDSFDDELKEERTIDTTGVMFKGKNLYSVTDVPGHKEFIKNMLTGASHADIAVLVVAAGEGIQEQTRRHSFLLHMLGIKQLFVFINKMDLIDYSESGFEVLKGDVAHFLASFDYRDVLFIPGSALEGDNIYKRSARMDWYRGPALIEALDSVEIHRENKPARYAVQDVYHVGPEEVIVGRVESGSLRRGDEVVFQPSDVRGRVERIITFGNEMEMAGAGDSIGLVATCIPKRGDVGGLATNAPLPSRLFLGEAVLLDERMKTGDILELRCGTARVKCEIREMREKIDSQTGEVVRRNPTSIGMHEAATIVFATDPIVVEKFSDIPELGRFVLARGKNIGAGIVLETMS
jgi:bifunctional enzyme CysN/CysC